MAGSRDPVRYKHKIDKVLSDNREKLHRIGLDIWKNPESSFQETKAYELLTAFLKEEGFNVEEHFVAATGFRANFTSSSQGRQERGGGDGAIGGGGEGDEVVADQETGLHVCFLCEYDAVAEVGHAAGHNLRSEGSLAAALCIKRCLETNLFPGQVTVLGTPGEDVGCGTKINMIDQGTFSDIDLCLMPTPFQHNILYPRHFTMLVVTVIYKGKAAHASAAPWEGRNALDAAVACYTNIALMRQQLKPTWSINGIILAGGVQANVVPQHSEMKFWLRASDDKDLVILKHKCTACFVAAAKATVCEVDFNFDAKPYYPLEHNTVLGDIYKRHAQELGVTFTEDQPTLQTHIGSTDFGNVSQVVPCISPAYDIGCGPHVVINSIAFHEASGTLEAQERTVANAKVLAYTAAEVMYTPSIMTCVQEEHKQLHTVSSSDNLRQRIHSVELPH